jgi:hypothetical protein
LLGDYKGIKYGGILNHIEEILVKDIKEVSLRKSYYAACYNFRQSLTSISISQLDKFKLKQPPSISALQFLSKFKHLTHLSLINESREKLDIYSILTTCPNLSLKIDSYTPIIISPDDNLPPLSGRSQLQIIDICELAGDTDLKRLLLSLTSSSTSLRTLKLSLAGKFFAAWLQDFATGALFNLGNRLRSIKDLDFHIHDRPPDVGRADTLRNSLDNASFQNALKDLHINFR